MKRGIAALLLLCLVLSGCAPEQVHADPEPTSAAPIACVVLDAGHGGIDQGCVGVSGGLESELNLDVTLRLKEALEARSVTCILTREDETVFYDENDSRTHKSQDMAHRAEIIQGSSADAVVSIHMNVFLDASVNGPQVFYKTDDPASRDLAHTVQTALADLPEVEKRRTEQAGDLYILNASPCPAILIECAFLSNPREDELMQTESYRQTLADTLADSLVLWLQG